MRLHKVVPWEGDVDMASTRDEPARAQDDRSRASRRVLVLRARLLVRAAAWELDSRAAAAAWQCGWGGTGSEPGAGCCGPPSLFCGASCFSSEGIRAACKHSSAAQLPTRAAVDDVRSLDRPPAPGQVASSPTLHPRLLARLLGGLHGRHPARHGQDAPRAQTPGLHRVQLDQVSPPRPSSACCCSSAGAWSRSAGQCGGARPTRGPAKVLPAALSERSARTCSSNGPPRR